MARHAKDGEVKSTTISVRSTQDLRDRLDAAAAAAGRSLAEEVQTRLERSLRDDPPGQAPWSDVTRNFARIVGLALSSVETMAGRRWIESKAGCEAARSTVAAIFAPVHPPHASAEPMDEREREEADRLSAYGRATADFLTFRTDLHQYRATLPTAGDNRLSAAANPDPK